MKLILHFGLHRSASSALQRFLTDNDRRFIKRRVLALSQRSAKREAFRTFTLLKGTHIGMRGPQPNFARIDARLKAIAGDVDALIFSDENMPGLMIGERGGAFSRAGRFAAMLRLLAETHEVHAVAILRRHADWLESIHRFAAWHGEPRDFPAFLAQADLPSVNFRGLLDEMADAVGRERVHVFSYEGLNADGGRAVLERLLALAGTRLPVARQLPLANVSADPRFVALMQTLHAHGVVLPRLTTLALRERLLLPDAGTDSASELADALASAGRRVFVPVASGRRFRWVHGALEAGLPLPGISAAQAQELVANALAAAAEESRMAGARMALKRELTDRFAADREAVASLYLPEWREGAGHGNADGIAPDAALDLTGGST